MIDMVTSVTFVVGQKTFTIPVGSTESPKNFISTHQDGRAMLNSLIEEGGSHVQATVSGKSVLDPNADFSGPARWTPFPLSEQHDGQKWQASTHQVTPVKENNLWGARIILAAIARRVSLFFCDGPTRGLPPGYLVMETGIGEIRQSNAPQTITPWSQELVISTRGTPPSVAWIDQVFRGKIDLPTTSADRSI